MNFKYFNYGIKEFNAPSWLVRTPHRYRRGQRSNPDKRGFFQAFFFAAALFVTSTVMIFTFKSGNLRVKSG